MKVFDPLYGEFTLRPEVALLAAAPEVRRLSQVRLLNALTPSLATLGEVRRYSHTLGVVYLATQNRFLNRSRQGGLAFQVAVLLHDIGTPPFGHLLEYHLRDRYGWHHEQVIAAILWGTHAPENTAHQIFARQAGRVRRLLDDANIPLDSVQAIIEGREPISRLLAGTLDLDNLDNVARMAMALGRPDVSFDSVTLARELSVGPEGELLLPHRHHQTVAQWLRTRRWVYQILTTDVPTIAAQAILSQALEIAIGVDLIGIDDWALSDEQLIERLLSCPDTKKLIGLNYLGKLPGLACMATFRGTLEDAGFATRQQLHTAVRDEVHRQTGDNSIIVYVFVDRGALERRIEFVDPEDDTQWAVGHTSATLFLYLLKRSGTAHQEALLRILASTLNGWTIHATTASACADRVDDQPTLDFEIRTG